MHHFLKLNYYIDNKSFLKNYKFNLIFKYLLKL